MKKQILLIVVLFTTVVFTQDLPKIAVYVTGDLSESEKRALGTEMLSALVKIERFTAVERSAAFAVEIERELKTQHSGAIDDDQISRLGKQFGVRFVCIADAAIAFGSHQVSARILNVETAEVLFIGRASGNLNSMQALETLSSNVINDMFGNAAPSVLTKTVSVKSVQSNQALPQSEVAVCVVSESMNSDDPQIQGLEKEILKAFMQNGQLVSARFGKEVRRAKVTNDGAIIQLGKQFGSQNICIVYVGILESGERQVSVRIFNAETAEIIMSGLAYGSVHSQPTREKLAVSLIGNMFDKSNVPVQPTPKKSGTGWIIFALIITAGILYSAAAE